MSTRERLPQRGFTPTAATGKTADPYTMNQERRPGSEPTPTQYESGNPDSWAETPTPVNTWEKEYAAGRNEVGEGNFLDSTWKDREPGTPYDKAAAQTRSASEDRVAEMEAARKLASKAISLTQKLFPSANESFVMAQARDFMRMAPAALDSTIARVIGAGEEEEEEEVEEENEACDKKSHIATLRAELEDIKTAFDAAQHADIIAALERRLLALEKKAGEDVEEENEEVAEEVEAKKTSTERLEALNAYLASVIAGEEKVEEDVEEESASDVDVESKKAGELDIELGTPEMDTIASDNGDLLDEIFTAHERQAAEKKGVKKLGGGSKTASVDGGVDLSNLWKSDPDISGEFR